MKNSGLSQLADAARELTSPLSTPYPVKQKHQPRRLLPNQAGIDWLESEENYWGDTRIATWASMAGTDDKLLVLYADRRRALLGAYARPMIQIIPNEASSSSRQSVHPCSCDDFTRSWDAVRCPDHHELRWDTERRTWSWPNGASPALEEVTIYASPTLAQRADNLNEALRRHPAACRCLSCLNRQRGRGPRPNNAEPFIAAYAISDTGEGQVFTYQIDSDD